MRIFVAGVTGLIGARLVPLLVAMTHNPGDLLIAGATAPLLAVPARLGKDAPSADRCTPARVPMIAA